MRFTTSRHVAIALGFWMAASVAAADEITLRTGSTIIGIAREEGDKIVVEMGIGTAWFAREEVVAITRGPTPLHEYRKRFEALRDSASAGDFAALARWCRLNGVPRYTGELLRRALELDPEHQEARLDAGYVKIDGKWLAGSELKRALGYEWHEGRWMLPLEIELQRRKRLDAEHRRIEREGSEPVRPKVREVVRVARSSASYVPLGLPSVIDPGDTIYGYYGYPPYVIHWGWWWRRPVLRVTRPCLPRRMLFR